MGCAIIDLDGTLVEGPSCERRFVRYLWREGRLGPGRTAAALAFALRHVPRYGRNVWRKDKAYLAGLSAEEVELLAARFVETEVEPALRPSMLARIERHRRAGDAIGLLTGTIDAIAAPVAARIGARALRATLPDTRCGRYTTRPPHRHPFGVDKIPAAEALAVELGCTLAATVAYADSAADIPLLRTAGRPVAVAPDAGLRRAAVAAGWEIVEV